MNEPADLVPLPGATPSFDDIVSFACSRIGSYVKAVPDSIDIDGDLSLLGLDSSDAVVLAAELEEWLGLEIEPELFLRHPSLRPALQEIFDVLQTPA